MADETRRYPRFDVTRTATVTKLDDEGQPTDPPVTGPVANVSASGVSLSDPGTETQFQIDDVVRVSVDGMQSRDGRVVRATETLLAIDFGLEANDEHKAIAEIGVISGELSGLLDG